MQTRRLKDNFSIIRAEDRPKLLQAKDEVEAEMNKLKWKLIRDKVKQKGGDANYTVSYALPELESADESLMTSSPTSSSGSTRR